MPIFKKNKKKFIIIIGAGRCGTTYLVNELNKIKDVNIFGENKGSIMQLINVINNLKKTLILSNNSKKFIDDDLRKIYKKNNYINVEWYNDSKKILKLLKSLDKNLFSYFNSMHKIVGFKEIRFDSKESVENLKYFELNYDVYYIHLIRDIKSQSNSAFFKDKINSKEKINLINNNISSVFENNKNYLKIDITDIKDNINIVKEFIGIK